MTTKEINLLHRDLFVKYGPEHVDLITTHASWVLLSPQYAYKIKKPVQFSFLDYSTIEKRKKVCQDELRLNRRLTSGMYLDVVGVYQKDERYYLEDAHGALLDYALKMTRMDPSRQMDELLLKDQVNIDHIKAIAQQLSTFHKSTRRLYQVTHLQQLKDLFNDIAVIEPLLYEHFGKESVAFLQKSIQLSDEFLEDHIDRLQERERDGWVIDGHGDLHSRNIFLMEQPIIFDCIEFNEEFRIMDVLNEIAFFCMDLHFFGRQDLAAHFLDAYLRLIPCIEKVEDWNIFHYFKLYRANVRLKVNGLNAMQSEKPEELKALLQPVNEYLKLYTYYLRALS